MTIKDRLNIMFAKESKLPTVVRNTLGRAGLRQLFKSELVDGKQWQYFVNPFGSSRYAADDSTYIADGYAGNPDVYAIIRYILRASSAIKYKAVRVTRDGQEQPLEDHHVISRLMKKPNELQSMSEFQEDWLGYKHLIGNTYVHTLVPEFGVNAGKPTQLSVLPANYVKIETNKTTGEITGYKFADNPVIEPARIFHSKYFNPLVDKDGTLYGLSPLAAALRLLSMSNAGYDAEKSSVEAGGMRGVLSGSYEDAWNEDEITRVQNTFDRDFSGAENYGKMLVTSARMHWTQVGVSPADLELMQMLRLTKQQLAAIYSFPSQLINDKDGSLFNTYREAKKGLYTDVCIPETQPFVQMLNEIAQAHDENIKVVQDLSAIDVLQDDKAELAQWLSIAWWIKASDKQRMMNMPVDEALDEYYVPSGLVPMSELSLDIDEELKRADMIFRHDKSTG